MFYKTIVITGGIASGKTEVLNILKKFGYLVFDADKINARCLEKETVVKKITHDLNENIIDVKSKKIDRKKLRTLAFRNKDFRKRLEGILHPEIQKEFETCYNRIRDVSRDAWIFYEASLVLENNNEKLFHISVLVKSTLDIRMKRLKNIRNLDMSLIENILKSQLSDDEKEKRCDFIIENNGSLEELRHDIQDVLLRIRNKFLV